MEMIKVDLSFGDFKMSIAGEPSEIVEFIKKLSDRKVVSPQADPAPAPAVQPEAPQPPPFPFTETRPVIVTYGKTKGYICRDVAEN